MKFPHPFLNAAGQLRNGWWIALFMLLLAGVIAPLILLAGDSGGDVPIAVQTLALLVVSVLCQKMRRKPLAELFGALDWRWPRELALGALLGAALMLAPALALLTIGAVRFVPSAAGVSALFPGLVLFAGVAAAEELMFRGFVFQRLIDGLGVWPAQAIVALFFVLTHSTALEAVGPLSWLAGANIAMASVMFGLAFVRTRSLAMPLGLHFAANFVQGSILGFGVSGDGDAGLLRPVFQGPDWLTGGAFGLEASAPGFAGVILVATLLLLAWPRAGKASA